MLIDEDTDDENFRNNAIPKDGVWININDLPEQFYDLKEYNPRYVIPDDDIIEDSPTGSLIINFLLKSLNF